MKTSSIHIALLLITTFSQGMAKSQSPSTASVVQDFPTNILIIICVLLMTFLWLGCTYFIASRHQKAVEYLQNQLDELWLLQAKPSVWPHAPFIPNPRGENPPEYIPPKNPEEQQQEDKEAMERAKVARAFLEARKKDKCGKNNDSESSEF
ncbi:uncharacterized protein [Drosophila kikkawai]|uniref:Uncharacterized protein n=1 Tax=Drosophila kikkawai TaxID=30033 RepID=A0A6P4IDG9_DROKI|nr:uncharacterized protein LOC108073662 [Drosophila kikkawai]KAH8308297.1 hypothetical protein KR059_010079 [Drosophila kikkawai]